MLHNSLFFCFLLTFVTSISFGASLFVSDFKYLHLIIFIISATLSIILLFYTYATSPDSKSLENTTSKKDDGRDEALVRDEVLVCLGIIALGGAGWLLYFYRYFYDRHIFEYIPGQAYASPLGGTVFIVIGIYRLFLVVRKAGARYKCKDCGNKIKKST